MVEAVRFASRKSNVVVADRTAALAAHVIQPPAPVFTVFGVKLVRAASNPDQVSLNDADGSDQKAAGGM